MAALPLGAVAPRKDSAVACEGQHVEVARRKSMHSEMVEGGHTRRFCHIFGRLVVEAQPTERRRTPCEHCPRIREHGRVVPATHHHDRLAGWARWRLPSLARHGVRVSPAVGSALILLEVHQVALARLRDRIGLGGHPGLPRTVESPAVYHATPSDRARVRATRRHRADSVAPQRLRVEFLHDPGGARRHVVAVPKLPKISDSKAEHVTALHQNEGMLRAARHVHCA
mmetsp:Transcript_93216/g.266455  ORF Transcript_93216/g.266455 Transcript_93216/m.266455 type:complete len:227 (-) Transcript_93216:399-1079(-)